MIDLQGCLNFRDLGGYPTADGRQVRWRMLFRSDSLELLSSADVARLHGELGIGDVIDLRSTAERRADIHRPLDGEAIRQHHSPLFDGDTSGESAADAREARGAEMKLADRYLALAEFARQPIARVLQIVAEAPGAAVYHCAAGKDRTGVISAVILGSLGVRDEIIAADYAATRDNLDAIVERLLATEGYQSMLSALPPDTLHAEPETMLGLLDGLRERYGSVHEYARAAGVADDTLRILSRRLLE